MVQVTTENGSTESYAGDVSVEATWEGLQSVPEAVLVDVRTRAEWSFVGVPDLSALGKEPLMVEWQSFPSMEVNPSFTDVISEAVKDSSAPIYLLCRSGARSRAAAIMLTASGHSSCFNILGGFEGPHDASRQRGKIEGWKARGLPWVQG